MRCPLVVATVLIGFTLTCPLVAAAAGDPRAHQGATGSFSSGDSCSVPKEYNVQPAINERTVANVTSDSGLKPPSGKTPTGSGAGGTDSVR